MKPWWLQIRLGSKHPSPPYPSRLVRATLISSWTALSLLTGFSLFFPPAQTIHSIFTEQPDSLAPCKRKWDHAAALPETLRRRSSHRGKPSSSRMLTGPTSPALPSDLRSLCSPSQPPTCSWIWPRTFLPQDFGALRWSFSGSHRTHPLVSFRDCVQVLPP